MLFAVLVAAAVVVAKAAEYDARKGLNFLRLDGRGSVSKENMNLKITKKYIKNTLLENYFLIMYFFFGLY